MDCMKKYDAQLYDTREIYVFIKERENLCPRNGIMMFVSGPQFNGNISLGEKNKVNFYKRIRNL